MKYADARYPVMIFFSEEAEFVDVLVQNQITEKSKPVESTGIGEKSMSILMKEMGGKYLAGYLGGRYWAEICFCKADKGRECKPIWYGKKLKGNVK